MGNLKHFSPFILNDAVMLEKRQPYLTLGSPNDVPAPFRRLQTFLARALDTTQFHWTIIILSCLEFIFSISSILADYLKDSSCICTNSCPDDSVLLGLFEYFSLFITGLFILEIPMDLIAFGFKFYLPLPHHDQHWFLHLFDAIVVIGAFILALGAQGPLESVASLLIILRLWRVIKLVASLEEVQENEEEEEKIKKGKQEKVRRASEDSPVEEGGWESEREGWRAEVVRLRKRVRELEQRSDGEGGESEMEALR